MPAILAAIVRLAKGQLQCIDSKAGNNILAAKTL